jgi:hypothetical protein
MVEPEYYEEEEGEAEEYGNEYDHQNQVQSIQQA